MALAATNRLCILSHDLVFALVAQRIEWRFPKPKVAGSIPAWGTGRMLRHE